MSTQGSEEANSTYRTLVGAVEKVPFFNVSVSGQENLPQEGGFLLAMTHHNAWDVQASGVAVYRHTHRPVHYVGYEDFLDGTNRGILYRLAGRRNAKKIGQLLADAHALPINRNGALPDQTRRIVKEIKKGSIVGIYTEQGRVDGRRVAEFGRGASVIASKSEATIVPAAIAGRSIGRINSIFSIIPRRLHVHFGEPFESRAKTKAEHEYTAVILRNELQTALDIAYEELARRSLFSRFTQIRNSAKIHEDV